MALESTWGDPEPEPEGAASDETADLPKAVATLRSLEDEILAAVAASEKTLRSLEAREVHVLAGYPSFQELEERLLGATVVLGPLRNTLRGPRVTARRAGDLGLTEDDRSRRVKALASIARAVARLHQLDDTVREAAEAASAALGDIEARRSYEQCGYTSQEDFLERAIAPSVALSSAVIIAGDAARAAHPRELVEPADPVAPVDEAPWVAMPAAPPEVVSPGSTGSMAPRPVPSAKAGPTAARRSWQVPLGLALATVAAIAGAVAGVVLWP